MSVAIDQLTTSGDAALPDRGQVKCRWSFACLRRGRGAGFAALASLYSWFVHAPGIKVVLPATRWTPRA